MIQVRKVQLDFGLARSIPTSSHSDGKFSLLWEKLGRDHLSIEFIKFFMGPWELLEPKIVPRWSSQNFWFKNIKFNSVNVHYHVNSQTYALDLEWLTVALLDVPTAWDVSVFNMEFFGNQASLEASLVPIIKWSLLALLKSCFLLVRML